MEKDERIWVVVGDLGYKMWDKVRDDFPDRFLNTGASETAMINIAVGLAMSGKIPFVYSITPFLLYRPFEVLRTYVNHERINIKLVGSGRNKDYVHDGFSHDASDVNYFLNGLPHIFKLYPDVKEQIPACLDIMLKSNDPYFLSLKR